MFNIDANVSVSQSLLDQISNTPTALPLLLLWLFV